MDGLNPVIKVMTRILTLKLIVKHNGQQRLGFLWSGVLLEKKWQNPNSRWFQMSKSMSQYRNLCWNSHHTLNFFMCVSWHTLVLVGHCSDFQHWSLYEVSHTSPLTELSLNWIMWRNSCLEGQRSRQAFECLDQKQLDTRLEKKQTKNERKKERENTHTHHQPCNGDSLQYWYWG